MLALRARHPRGFAANRVGETLEPHPIRVAESRTDRSASPGLAQLGIIIFAPRPPAADRASAEMSKPHAPMMAIRPASSGSRMPGMSADTILVAFGDAADGGSGLRIPGLRSGAGKLSVRLAESNAGPNVRGLFAASNGPGR